MSQECNHDCSNCSENCSERIQKLDTNSVSHIKKIIGVVSGKGGVGKSLVTSLLASSLNKKGYKVGILDADITGPSIPQSFKIRENAYAENELIFPAKSRKGILVISAALLLENNEEAIIWRGAMISNLVKQFYTDVRWEKLDVLLIDMPPGTSDVPLTVFQSIPVDGIVIVSSPQALVSTIVAKAYNMAAEMNIKVLGIIENMAYVECKDCKSRNYVFGQSHLDVLANKYDIDALAQIPLNEEIASKVDLGDVEDLDIESIDQATDIIIKKLGGLDGE